MEPVDKDKKDPFVRLPGGLPVPTKLFTTVAQGIFSGRKQAALDRAVQKGGMFAPGIGISKSAEEILGKPSAGVAPVGERLTAAGEVAKAQKEVEERPITPSAKRAMEAAGEGDWGGTFNAILSDPVGSLGFLAAESTARNPLTSVLGVVPLAGSYIGSFGAERRAGITSGITEEMQKRGLDPTNEEDVFNALSDKELLRGAFEKATAGAQALASTETLIEMFAGPLTGDIARPLLRQSARLGSEVLGEAAGETARQVATGEDINLVEATLEGLSTVGQSVATTVGSEVLEQAAKSGRDQEQQVQREETAQKVLKGEAPPEDAFDDFFAQGIRINRILEPTKPQVAGEIEVEPEVRRAAEVAVLSLINEQRRIASESTFRDDPKQKVIRDISGKMPFEIAQFVNTWDASGRVEAAERAAAAVEADPEFKRQMTFGLKRAFGDEIVIYRGGTVDSRLQSWSLSPIISQRFAEGELAGPSADRPGKRPVQQAKIRPEDVAFVANLHELELVVDGSALREVKPTSLQELKDDLISSLNMLGMNDLAQDLGAVSDPTARGQKIPIVTKTKGEPKQTTGEEAASQMQEHLKGLSEKFPESEIPVESANWSEKHGVFLYEIPNQGSLLSIEPAVDIFGDPTWVLYTPEGIAIEEVSQNKTGAVQELKFIGQEYLEDQGEGGTQLLEEGEAVEVDVVSGELSGKFASKIRIELSPTREGWYRITILEGSMEGGSFGRSEKELPSFLKESFGIDIEEVLGGGESEIQAQGVNINRLFGPGAEPDRPGVAGEATQDELADEEGRLMPPPTDEELANLTGSSRAIVERTRRIRGLEDLPGPESVAWKTDLKIAIQKKIPERALSIAEGLIANPRPITSTEVIGMTFRKAQLEQSHDENMARAEELIDMGRPGAAQIYIDRADSFLQEIDIIENGVQRGGTESARATAAFGAGYRRPDMSLANIRRRIKARKKRPLTEKEEQRIREVFDRLKRAEENLKVAQRKADASEQEVIKGLARKVALANKPKEEVRGQKLEEIKSQREEIKKQIRALGFRANNALGASAELTYLAGKLALTYMREGLVNLDSLVSKLMEDLPDLTREEAFQAIATQSPEIQQEARQTAEQDVKDFQRQQEILDDFNTLQAENPEKAKKILNELQNISFNKEKDNDRLTKIEQQINSIKERLANVEAEKPFVGPFRSEEEVALLQELSQLRTLLNLEQKIANLQDQMNTGNFRSPVRRRKAPDTPEIQNAKVRLMRAKAEVRKITRGPDEFQARDIVIEPVRLMRELMVTGEMSSVFRQGLGLIMASPGSFPNAYKTAFKAFFKEDIADHIDLMLQESVFHPIRQEAGLELTFREGLSEREEVFSSKLLQRVPAMRELLESHHPAVVKAGLAGPAAIKSIINAAERHWTTFLNMMRIAVFDEYVAQHPDADMETLKQLAKITNALSGRGNLKLGADSFASLIFFAPRFAISRVEAPARAAKLLGDPDLRPLAAAGMVRMAMWGASWLGLASLAGISVGWDKRDSDFGKIVWGNTRIDIWGGFQQPYVTLMRIILSGIEQRDPDFEGRKLDGYDLLKNFSLYKTSPAVTFPMAIITGKDVVGNEVSTLEAIGNVSFPLFLQDIKETGERRGFGPGIGTGLAVGQGIGVQTFGSQITAGDVKPFFGKARYYPPAPAYPDAIKEDRKRKERLDFTFGALIAKRVREDKELLKTLKQGPLKEKLQGYRREAIQKIQPLIQSAAIPERIIEEFEETEGITP